MAKLTDIQLWNAGRTSEIESDGKSLLSAIASFPEAVWRLGSFATLTLNLISGHPFVTGDLVKDRRVIRRVWDDGHFDEWRVITDEVVFTDTISTFRATHIEADLADRVFTSTLANGKEDYTLALVGITAQDALDLILDSDSNTPSHFAPGTVVSTFASTEVAIEANGNTHIDLLRQLCDQLVKTNGRPCEWELVLDEDTGVYTVNVVLERGWTDAEKLAGTADATLRPLHQATGGSVSSQSNIKTWKRKRDYQGFFSRIRPLAGEETLPETIGKAYWHVTSATYTLASDTTDVTLEENAIYSEDFEDFSNPHFGNDDDGFFVVDAATVPNQIRLLGDASALDGTRSRFARDSAGKEYTYLELASESSGKGVVERIVRLEDIPRFENWLEESGISTDLSTWSGGMPVGWVKIGSPTVTEETGTQYVRYGTKSAKVVAQEGEGIMCLPRVTPTQDEPWFSAWINQYVESGRIRLEFLDAQGRTIPPGPTFAESNKASLLGLSIGGMDPLPLDAENILTVRIFAVDGAATFYVDAATLTQSTEPVQYRKEMGPRALWLAAGKLLVEEGGTPEAEFDGDVFDASQFDVQYELLVPGGHAELKAFFTGGEYKVDTTVRIQEVVERADTSGVYSKTLKVNRPRKTVSSRLVHRPRAPILDASPPKDRTQTAPTPGDPTGAGLNIICGRATIENGNTSVTVTDALPDGVRYDLGTVLINPTESWGSATEWWPHDETVASFKISVDQDPGKDLTFKWVLVYPCPFPTDVPEAITGAACEGGGDGTITISWPAHADDPDGYVLRYGTDDGGPYPNQVIIPDADLEEKEAGVYQYTVSGLTNGTTYYSIVIPYWNDTTPDGARIDHNEDIRVDADGNTRVFTEA